MREPHERECDEEQHPGERHGDTADPYRAATRHGDREYSDGG